MTRSPNQLPSTVRRRRPSGRSGGSALAPRRLVRDVLLRDGSTLRLQASAPADFADIKAFYDGLSPESRYLRFHGYAPTDVVARTEAEASGVDRLVLIARHNGRVVATARYEGLREPGVAEVAFAVADEMQGHGIGTRMLEQLAAVAAERGIHRFDAEVLPGNAGMLGVFEHAGFAVRRRSYSGEVTVSLDIAPTKAVRERIDGRDHFAAIASLRAVLAPSSVAVLGGAAAPGGLGRKVMQNIIAGEFQGLVTPVNHEGEVVCSIAAARNLDELAAAPDLVIITAAGEELLDLAAEAAHSGTRAMLVISAGPEDDDGLSGLNERLLEIVRGAGLRVVGPHSLGVVNTDPAVSLNATFSGASVRPGALGICSQSAAPGIGLLGYAAARHLGVSTLVSLGDRADVSTNDLLEYFEEDERTAAVMLYLETFGNPEHFIRIAQRVSRKKPILALKGRRQVESRRSDRQSDTAAALRGDAVVDALLHQAGVLRLRSGEELFDAAEFFACQPLPSGRQIGIITNSAGVATLATDACAARGLELARGTTAANPLVFPVSASVDEYAARIPDLLADPAIDALMVCYVDLSDDPDSVLAATSAAAVGQPKPVVASIVRSDGQLPRHGDASGVPNYLFPDSCAGVLARAAERREWLSRPLGERPHFNDLQSSTARGVISTFLDREPAGGWLTLEEADRLLAAYGIATAGSRLCRAVEEAVEAAAAVARPVVLKADLPAPAHASDIDAVLLGLEGEAAIRSAWGTLQHRVRTTRQVWKGAVIQPLAPVGANVLVGAVVDPELGLALAVGLGGRQARLSQTAEFRLPPETDTEADELIDSSAGVLIQLDRFRGSGRLDRKALRDLILRFALLLQETPEIAEADLNPVRCTTHGCVVLDTRLRIEPPRHIERAKTW